MQTDGIVKVGHHDGPGGGGGVSGGGGNAAAVGSVRISEQILLIMERLLVEATQSVPSVQIYCQFASDSVAKEDIVCLLQHAVALKAGTALHQRYNWHIKF